MGSPSHYNPNHHHAYTPPEEEAKKKNIRKSLLLESMLRGSLSQGAWVQVLSVTHGPRPQPKCSVPEPSFPSSAQQADFPVPVSQRCHEREIIKWESAFKLVSATQLWAPPNPAPSLATALLPPPRMLARGRCCSSLGYGNEGPLLP